MALLLAILVRIGACCVGLSTPPKKVAATTVDIKSEVNDLSASHFFFLFRSVNVLIFFF